MARPRALLFTVVAAALFLVLWFHVPQLNSSSNFASLDKTDLWTQQDLTSTVDESTTESSQTDANEKSTSELLTSCTVAYDESKSVFQYVVMIDAGSTGSRVHVYKFNNCNPSPVLDDEFFKMSEPGLSSYADDPDAGARSLDELLDYAMEHVPKEYQSCSPIAVKATAGLRLTGPAKAKAILDKVHQHLERDYPFPVVEKGGVEIMDGSMEGVYAWITINYLLGNLNVKPFHSTVAVMDLGGASTQVVFEPKYSSPSETLAEGDHRYVLDYNGDRYTLYQHSHLGYGLKEARKAVHKEIVDAYNVEPKPDSMLHPCLPVDTNITLSLPPASDDTLAQDVVFHGPPFVPAALQCRAYTEKILNKDEHCSLFPCSFNGVHQPRFRETFLNDKIFLISYFYDRMVDIGMPSTFTIEEMKDLADQVCRGPQAWSLFSNVVGAVDALTDEPEWCLDLNYMITLLATGYDIPNRRELHTAKKINGMELGWCLGASLPLLSSETGHWTCKVSKEV
ncbi:guanosine-diphosphatase Gda1 [Schizosaccharomyces japonicus yFS275]|uniref:guanosine-diphosphatase n=1 Tax=Schizosaccharomyces japonicus (strain yFS275 / FY16936) TaxID=402676 RepID=B6JYD5_SCHJY|nr:guanosine-diphosphatase Gda1 [Schizosaccharomyces japonicus yFS275]EEB06553.1 guanosine-diphosphatase Gda1 [Schizosaccharomyces japonicus yFS275]